MAVNAAAWSQAQAFTSTHRRLHVAFIQAYVDRQGWYGLNL